MNFITYIFQEFQPDFKLSFIALLLGIISWKGASRFNGGGFIFEWGIRPKGGVASVLMEGGLKKIIEWGEGDPPPPVTMGTTADRIHN